LVLDERQTTIQALEKKLKSETHRLEAQLAEKQNFTESRSPRTPGEQVGNICSSGRNSSIRVRSQADRDARRNPGRTNSRAG
jgi:hypothetical protein